MGMYLRPYRVDLKRVDSLRNGKDPAWQRLLPAIKDLSVKEREPLEHFVYEEKLPPWHAAKYLQVTRFLCKAFGAPLKTEIWGIINYHHSFDIFRSINALIKGLALPVSLIDDVEQCSGTLWGMPIVDGVAVARMDPQPIAEAARILRQTLAKQDKLLHEVQTWQKKYQDEPQLCTYLRYASICYRVGSWSAEELADRLELDFASPMELDSRRDCAQAMLDHAWGGDENAEYLFGGTQKFFDWIEEAAQHKEGLVFFLE